MAAFFRRSCFCRYEVPRKNKFLIKRYGTDNQVKLKKAFGLVSCLQLPTASCDRDQPELKGASIPDTPIAEASSCLDNIHQSSTLSDFKYQVFMSKVSAGPGTDHGTLQKTTSTFGEIIKRIRMRLSHYQSKLSKKELRQSDGVQLFSCMRTAFSSSQVLLHPNYFSSLSFKQRESVGILKEPLVRHYATGPRSRHKEKSYYEVLNTTPSATQAQVKEAYFKLSKIYHPDKNAGSKEAQRKFALINEAYSVLGNLTLRKRYDRGTLNQRDVHGEVKPEEKVAEEIHRNPTYTGSGIPFSMEAKRQAKNMDDFFSKHYKDARDKEQRDRAERQQRIEEYMELQKRAKISPFILAVFMIAAIVMAVKSVEWNDALNANEKKSQAQKDRR
ncbi:uncharacterized protein LOC121408848 [Lytechinus variegatus]|uniref:uncharacterized protein LOC121408848 n=1 Tax=Lytechinus variegatus TaxID=7654 RepID=UPI001BB15FC3|nr:uncharacterized protein LOC121408848 [Lytechinus variegatus]